MEDEIICTGCGWIGIESGLLHPPRIGWAVCPKCESPDDLINGEDLDEMDTVREYTVSIGVSDGWAGKDLVMMEGYESEVL